MCLKAYQRSIRRVVAPTYTHLKFHSGHLLIGRRQSHLATHCRVLSGFQRTLRSWLSWPSMHVSFNPRFPDTFSQSGYYSGSGDFAYSTLQSLYPFGRNWKHLDRGNIWPSREEYIPFHTWPSMSTGISFISLSIPVSFKVLKLREITGRGEVF